MSDGLTAEIVAGLRSPNDGKYVCGIAADLIESQARRISELEITLFDARQALIREGMEVNRLRDSQPPPAPLPDDLTTAIRFLEEMRDGAEDEWPALNEFLERVSGQSSTVETPAPLEQPETHIQGVAAVNECVRKIQMIAEEFGFDPTEWLNDEAAISNGIEPQQMTVLHSQHCACYWCAWRKRGAVSETAGQ